MHFGMIREGGPVPAERAIINILFFFWGDLSLHHLMFVDLIYPFSIFFFGAAAMDESQWRIRRWRWVGCFLDSSEWASHDEIFVTISKDEWAVAGSRGAWRPHPASGRIVTLCLLHVKGAPEDDLNLHVAVSSLRYSCPHFWMSWCHDFNNLSATDLQFRCSVYQF